MAIVIIVEFSSSPFLVNLKDFLFLMGLIYFAILSTDKETLNTKSVVERSSDMNHEDKTEKMRQILQ